MLTSCEELRRYIGVLDTEYASYQNGVGRAYKYWITAQGVSLLAGFVGATISLAIIETSVAKRITVAVLSALASLAGTVLTQLRLYELWRLREDVDPQYQKLVEDGHRRAAECSSSEQCSLVHKELLEQRAALLKDERDRWFAVLQNTSVITLVKKR
jgi:hypothetical protein